MIAIGFWFCWLFVSRRHRDGKIVSVQFDSPVDFIFYKQSWLRWRCAAPHVVLGYAARDGIELPKTAARRTPKNDVWCGTPPAQPTLLAKNEINGRVKLH